MMSIPMLLELRSKVLVTIIPLIALSLAGCGGGGSDGGSSSSHDAPTDTTSSGISAFVQAGTYLTPPWKSESAAPRDASTSVSPHGRVRVWLDPAVVSSSVSDITPDAMAVKEMYDTTDQLVGRAAIVQTTTSNNDVVYWCYGPAGRCGDGEPEYTADAPLYGGATTTCHGCHGGLIFTRLP